MSSTTVLPSADRTHSVPPATGGADPARWTPTGFALLLVVCGVAATAGPLGRHGSSLWLPVGGAALALLAWNALLVWTTRRSTGVRLTFAVDLRRQHYVQAVAQATVLAYWGWFWRPVYDMAPLIAAQVSFAYAFDLLVSWTRRRHYVLGFGVFPVVFSINLFLWFKPEHFVFQLLMVAVGLAAKSMLLWERDGRRVHIFNPSSFPLALASVILILTGTSDLTRGQDIAISQFYAPHMYVLLFLVGLPGQLLFGVATMTMAAVVTTYAFGLAYLAATGTYFFFDSYIPIAVFLGMHLLFTDPSTAPRTELGRLLFGVIYGLTAVALYRLLMLAGLPAFYDKLLQVPLMNLSVRAIDRLTRSPRLAWLDPARVAPSAPPHRRHLAYTGMWVLIFVAMARAGGVGDGHPGEFLPFWRDTCAAGRDRACTYLAQLEGVLCQAGSGWACNESGVRGVAAASSLPPDQGRIAAARAATRFDQGCRLGFVPACRNRTRSAAPERSAPAAADFPVLLRGSKGPVTERSPERLRAQACARGWIEVCGG